MTVRAFRLIRPNRPVVAAVAALAAVTLGGCGAFEEPPAATVDGAEVGTDDLLAEVEAIEGNPALRSQFESQGLAVTGEAEGTYSTDLVGSLLQNRIYLLLIEQALEERGVAIDEAAVAQQREALEAQLGDAPATVVDRQARQRVLIETLGDELVGEDPQELYEDEPGAFAEVCVSHIFVSTQERSPEEAEARAEELAEQLAGGASFEQLASEESDDAAAAADQGSLGCGGPGRFIPEFEDAVEALEPGQISEPVETSVGFHLIRVDERRSRTFEEASDDVDAVFQEARSRALSELIVEASADADVEVNPRFGNWAVAEGAPGGVEPPAGPVAPPQT